MVDVRHGEKGSKRMCTVEWIEMRWKAEDEMMLESRLTNSPTPISSPIGFGTALVSDSDR